MTAQELRDNCEQAIKELQDRFTHDKSEWMINSFAPGHSCGYVKVCLNCEKVIEKNHNDEETE